ncbi:unnamed protein product, partial [Prorocentrum cordatum]
MQIACSPECLGAVAEAFTGQQVQVLVLRDADIVELAIAKTLRDEESCSALVKQGVEATVKEQFLKLFGFGSVLKGCQTVLAREPRVAHQEPWRARETPALATEPPASSVSAPTREQAAKKNQILLHLQLDRISSQQEALAQAVKELQQKKEVAPVEAVKTFASDVLDEGISTEGEEVVAQQAAPAAGLRTLSNKEKRELNKQRKLLDAERSLRRPGWEKDPDTEPLEVPNAEHHPAGLEWIWEQLVARAKETVRRITLALHIYNKMRAAAPASETDALAAAHALEPGNLCGLHSFKFSGIANDQVLGLAPTKTGKKDKITLTTKAKKPAKLFEPKGLLLEKGIKKSAKKGPEQLKKVMDAGFYRKDLLDLAMAKYAKIRTSFKTKKLTVKSRRAKVPWPLCLAGDGAAANRCRDCLSRTKEAGRADERAAHAALREPRAVPTAV